MRTLWILAVNLFIMIFVSTVLAEEYPIWTIDKHIFAVEEILDRHKDMRDSKLNHLEKIGLKDTVKYKEAAQAYEREINDIEEWLDLVLKAKNGDYESTLQLMERENTCPKIEQTSATLLGLDLKTYIDYVKQDVARGRMFRELAEKNKTYENRHSLGDIQP